MLAVQQLAGSVQGKLLPSRDRVAGQKEIPEAGLAMPGLAGITVTQTTFNTTDASLTRTTDPRGVKPGDIGIEYKPAGDDAPTQRAFIDEEQLTAYLAGIRTFIKEGGAEELGPLLETAGFSKPDIGEFFGRLASEDPIDMKDPAWKSTALVFMNITNTKIDTEFNL